MRKNGLNRLIIATLLAIVVAMSVLTGCERKPLYLAGKGNVDLEVAVYDVRLELLWGVEWQTEWQYEWSSTIYGDLGYTLPEYIRANIYAMDPSSGTRYNPQIRNFGAQGGRVTLTPGAWYDMLFYNAGTEYILLNSAEDNSYVRATTRSSSHGGYTRNQLDQNGDSVRTYIDLNQPDEFFGVFLPELHVSEDPEDYDSYVADDGTVVYVYNINANMQPYSFIYLYQVMLLNNADSAGTLVTGAQGYTVTGLAKGTDLMTRRTSDEVISITSEDVKPLIKDMDLTLPDGSKSQGDILAGRMLTWGLPDIVPLEEVKYYTPTRAGDGGTNRREYVNPLDSNYIGIGLRLRNGDIYNVTRNITTQMNNRPAGGVITIVIDVNSIPDKAFDDHGGSTGGGGFNASVEDWANTEEAEIVI